MTYCFCFGSHARRVLGRLELATDNSRSKYHVDCYERRVGIASINTRRIVPRCEYRNKENTARASRDTEWHRKCQDMVGDTSCIPKYVESFMVQDVANFLMNVWRVC